MPELAGPYLWTFRATDRHQGSSARAWVGSSSRALPSYTTTGDTTRPIAACARCRDSQNAHYGRLNCPQLFGNIRCWGREQVGRSASDWRSAPGASGGGRAHRLQQTLIRIGLATDAPEAINRVGHVHPDAVAR